MCGGTDKVIFRIFWVKLILPYSPSLLLSSFPFLSVIFGTFSTVFRGFQTTSDESYLDCVGLKVIPCLLLSCSFWPRKIWAYLAYSSSPQGHICSFLGATRVYPVMLGEPGSTKDGTQNLFHAR